MTRTSLEKLSLSLIGITISTPVFAAGDSSGGCRSSTFRPGRHRFSGWSFRLTLAFVLMQRVVTPRIASVLEERHTRLMTICRWHVRQLMKLKTSAWRLKRNLQRPDRSKRQDTRHFAEAQAEAEKKNTAAAKRISTRLDKAEARIREARDAAMKELGDVATQGAIDAAATLAGIKVTKTDAKKAVAAAAKAIPMAGEQN